MKTNCEKCKGEGEIECGECGALHECMHCDGYGWIESCITEWTVPSDHKSKYELFAIQFDAMRCKDDHVRISKTNPQAKASYDRQLAETLAKLNAEASRFDQ